MNLIFYVEARYIKDSDGNIYNEEGVLKLSLWERYLEIFDHITIVARVKHVPSYLGKIEHLANGERVSFFELPYFYGPVDFLRKKSIISKRIQESAAMNGAFLLRVPGQIGTMAAKYLKKNKKRYGVEVVGDPYDVFSKGAVNHPLRIFFKYKYYYDLKRVVTDAFSTLYVTEKALQSRYKPKNGTFTTFASNVVLKEAYIKDYPKTFTGKKEIFKLISIGSLEQMYKAPDVVLKSVKLINDAQKKYRVVLDWIGAGKHLDEMKNLAKEMGIGEDVNFMGYISEKEQIISYLDKADVFILASRTEGLPRVIVEAMARGLPVLGTRVGGIPELVSEECLIERDNPMALALKIQYLIDNPELTNKISAENLERSKNYAEDILRERRKLFYRSLIST